MDALTRTLYFPGISLVFIIAKVMLWDFWLTILCVCGLYGLL